MSNHYLQKNPTQTLKIVSSEAVRKTQPPTFGVSGAETDRNPIRPGISGRLTYDLTNSGHNTSRYAQPAQRLQDETNKASNTLRQGSTYVPAGTYSSGIRSDYTYNPSISFSLTQSNTSGSEGTQQQQMLSSSASRGMLTSTTSQQQQPQQISYEQPAISMATNQNRETVIINRNDEGPNKPIRFLKPGTTVVGSSTSIAQSSSTSNLLGNANDIAGQYIPRQNINLPPYQYAPRNPEETSLPKRDSSQYRKVQNQPRFSSAYRTTDESELEKLRNENRSLNRYLLNLRITLESGRNSELEILKVENKELREQTASLRLTYEEKLNQLQQRTSDTKQEFEQFRLNADATIEHQQGYLNSMVRYNNKLKDLIDRLERERSEQYPRDFVALRRETARWYDNYENIKLEYRTLQDKHQKLLEYVKSLKATEDKLKTNDRMRDQYINNLNKQRLVLEEQIVELNNQRERQNGYYQRTLGKHAEYERQVQVLRREIDSLNRTIQQNEHDKTELSLRINELKVERKNLMDQSKRHTTSVDHNDSRTDVEKTALLNQLNEKVEEIGSLKKRISDLAGELGRKHDTDEVNKLKDRIARLYLENDKLRKYNKNPAGQFDEVLKLQLNETQRFKESLSNHSEVIYYLREDLKLAKSEIEQLQRETELYKLRLTVYRKNLNSQFAIEREAFAGELEVLKKTLRAAEDKARYWSNENRKKDEFMKMHLLGKTKSEYDRGFIHEFFRQYELHLPRLYS